MVNTYTTLDSLFTGIADAIRLKNGSTGIIIADTFPNEIRSLRTGFDYNNHNVTVIEDYQFKNCTDLRSVNCYSIENIGAGAFEGCTGLETVVLYDGVQNVGEKAFKGCNCIVYCMFDSQPDTWHENWNPDDCEVIWVGGVVDVLNCSFIHHANINTAKVYNDIYKDDYYILVINGDANIIHPNAYTQNPWGSYKITSAIIKDGVTGIGSYAFYRCTSLTSITIPDSITNIGNSAFYNCTSLTSIIIPDSITSIGDNAFNRCTSLTSITIPDSVQNINNHIFSYCDSLTSITISDSVTSIGNSAFSDCTSLTSINYIGTVAQWNAITFGTNWKYNTPNYTIHCTDGDIAKDGTITYHTSGGDN